MRIIVICIIKNVFFVMNELDEKILKPSGGAAVFLE